MLKLSIMPVNDETNSFERPFINRKNLLLKIFNLFAISYNAAYVWKYNNIMMKVVTISSLRTNMKNYFDEVSATEDVLIIPRNNNEDDAVVVISIKEYNALTETSHLMSTVANCKRLESAINHLNQGNTKLFNLEG
ncbi:type II toxin-antitoxin system Phd/YefM family antitoxin [Pedobacter sp. N23S346]|uniref:type II toxin-antitoxin system Phd/YefM family antitoxin n=1 Tax=Pedobacter sp. N23S346 TaxID=3402750 RepID=UPI003AC6C0C2